MAHKINFANGKHSFFSAREKAWHGLGQIVEQALTSEEAIIAAGLNYEVALADLYAVLNPITIDEAKESKTAIKLKTPLNKSNYFETKKVDGVFATYRTDTNQILGAVGSRYTIVQNKDAFTFFDSIVGEKIAMFETAGALGNGETIFITAKLPSYIKVGNKDDIEKYLLLTSSHDGKGAIQCMFTPIRVVCNNTLQMALAGNKDRVYIRHTKSAKDNLAEAHKLLKISYNAYEEIEQLYNEMTKVKIDDEMLVNYIVNAMDMKVNEEGELSTRSANQLETILEYAEIGPGQNYDVAKGTLWGAYNSITGYLANVKEYKSQEDRLDSDIFGTNYKTGVRALEIAKNLVKDINFYN